jgi:hypothetical protein
VAASSVPPNNRTLPADDSDVSGMSSPEIRWLSCDVDTGRARLERNIVEKIQG